MYKIIIMIAATALIAAAPAQTPNTIGSSNGMSPEARSYLDNAIKQFRSMHINASKLDWTLVTAQAYAAAANAKTTADTYPAIWLVIRSLGEKHTFLISPDQAKSQATGKTSNDVTPPALLLPEIIQDSNHIGIIRLYSFNGSDQQADEYRNAGKAGIKSLQDHGICKFIVDLRANVGGNMYPMIDAVSGLLGDGVLGTFANAAGQFTPWALKNGRTETSETVSSKPELSVGNKYSNPVAILIGPLTASAGEYTAMSFKGRNNTRFFGSPSAGYITANQPVPLSDGAVIIMTAGWGIDRTGKKYLDYMMPDEETGAGGPAVNVAINWLRHQSCTQDR